MRTYLASITFEKPLIERLFCFLQSFSQLVFGVFIAAICCWFISSVLLLCSTKPKSHLTPTFIFKFKSLKSDAVVRTLSILEFDFCFLLEYDADIKSVTSQALDFTINPIIVSADIPLIFSNRSRRAVNLFEVKHSS